MRREDLLPKIRQEALRFDPTSRPTPVRVRDLLKVDNENFVENLYRVILKRKLDPAGRSYYSRLSRIAPKPLIVYSISRSKAAKQEGTEITGLYSDTFSFVIGRPSALAKAMVSRVRESLSPDRTLAYRGKAERESKVDFFKFYVNFEEAFRGSEEEVEEGLKVYLPLLEGLSDPVVDLGSGRGEWLRLMEKEGLSVVGVEINPYFIDKCRSEGLKVVRSDVFKFLRNAEDSSIGAIIAFHLIEHLDPQRRLLFLSEIHRILKPGGMLLLETPNPRNILVSAGDFWRDPDHLVPVFPDTLSFMAGFVGFPDVRCCFFNKDRTALINCLDVDFRDLNDYTRASRDIALLARKS